MRVQTPESSARHTSDDGDARFALLVAQVAERLRPVCTGWEEARFQALVHRIARTKVQWDDACPGGRSRAD